ncbi:MAG: helix-turn-helix transcriptional regulator [Candidatus Wallbacteria bacterium]|nr:helix-turn-helix transcriptional regulator [Candidatus Wallbacteria bacterium]
MIRNEREYRITKGAANRFEETLALMGRERASSKLTPEKQKLVREAVLSQLEDLNNQVRAYERLKSGRRRHLQAKSIEELADVLIQARIALGLTQKELAERLAVKEQQVQRYEATRYAAASLGRVSEVAQALGLQVSVGVPLPRRGEERRR